MPETNSQDTIGPPSHGLPPSPPTGSVPSSEKSLALSTSSQRHRHLLRETWVDQIRAQFDDPSTGLKDRILALINEYHPGKPTGEHRWYYGSYNLSVACNYNESTVDRLYYDRVSLTPRTETPEATCKLEAVGKVTRINALEIPY